jgi:uncharacterized FAD-dependent dehydrogenase
VPFAYSNDDIYSALSRHIPVTKEEIKDTRIVKKTLNVSDKSDIHYDITIAFSLSPDREAGLLKMKKKVAPMDNLSFDVPACKFTHRPIVVGAGPAGLFATMLLAEAGARPILIERGLEVDERAKKVETFNRFSTLDPECNVQFGEGGAGTFSDGKLKVGCLDKYKYKVLSDFVSSGAPEDIIYTVGAHVGTDKLQNIVKKLRQRIESLGGEVLFSTKLTSLKIKDREIKGCYAERNGEAIELDSDTVILATGHSARDVFTMLKNSGAILEAKGFGIGLRIEHPRDYVDEIVYGKNAPDGLGTASYHLVTHLPNGRSVYSFCMCPGGTVVAATSEHGGIVTNGMSEYARNADNSNAAFLVSVTPADFETNDALAGIELQRKIERAAFKVAGENYRAPATSLGAFINGQNPRISSVRPSYSVGTELITPESYLPEYITESIKAAVPDFNAWMKGFYYPDAAMTGPETRTTSPVRVLRGGDFEAVGIKGLYPTGEGAGYAGGIISSARDGLMVAEAVISKHKK